MMTTFKQNTNQTLNDWGRCLGLPHTGYGPACLWWFMVRGQSWIVSISMISKAIVYFLFHLLGNNSRWFLNHWLFIFTSRGLTLWASGGEKLWLRHFITVTRKTSRTKWRPTCLVLSPSCNEASGKKITIDTSYMIPIVYRDLGTL